MSELNKMSLGYAVRSLRRQENMSVEVFADIVNLKSTYLTKIENGSIKNPSYEIVISLAKAIADFEIIKNGKINLDDYNYEFICGVRFFLNSSNRAEEYNNFRINQQINKNLLSEINGLEEADLLFIKRHISYKSNSIKLEKGENDFYNTIDSIFENRTLSDFGIYQKGSYVDYINYIADAFSNDVYIDKHATLRKLKKRINKELYKLFMEQEDFRMNKNPLSIFKDIIRLMFMYYYYKSADDKLNDDNFDDDSE